MQRHFLPFPAWLHRENPPWGLPRFRWGWTELSEQQWLDVRRRDAIGAGVFVVCAAVTLAVMVISGCRC